MDSVEILQPLSGIASFLDYAFYRCWAVQGRRALIALELPRGNQRNSFFSRYGFACFLSVEREYSSTAA